MFVKFYFSTDLHSFIWAPEQQLSDNYLGGLFLCNIFAVSAYEQEYTAATSRKLSDDIFKSVMWVMVI